MVNLLIIISLGCISYIEHLALYVYRISDTKYVFEVLPHQFVNYLSIIYQLFFCSDHFLVYFIPFCNILSGDSPSLKVSSIYEEKVQVSSSTSHGQKSFFVYEPKLIDSYLSQSHGSSIYSFVRSISGQNALPAVLT